MALPMPLILLGVIGVLVVVLVVRLFLKPSGGESGSSAPSPPIASVPDARPSAPPVAQVTTPTPSPVPPPEPTPAPVVAKPPPARVVVNPAPKTVAPTVSEPATRPAGATATIKISTAPPGAAVTIDGERQKRASNGAFPVAPGSHKLVIDKSGYYPQDMTVSDLKKDETRGASLTLKALPASAGGEGTIEIHIVPASKIFVNAEMVRSDVTDATLKLPAGAYTIRAVNGTFGSQEWRKEIKADAPAKIDYNFEAAAAAAATEAPKLGKLHVVSQGPAGAQVWVDGANTGLVTPCTVEHLKAGPHTVNLVLEGFAPERENQSVTIKAGGTADIKIKLKKRK